MRYQTTGSWLSSWVDSTFGTNTTSIDLTKSWLGQQYTNINWNPADSPLYQSYIVPTLSNIDLNPAHSPYFQAEVGLLGTILAIPTAGISLGVAGAIIASEPALDMVNLGTSGGSFQIGVGGYNYTSAPIDWNPAHSPMFGGGGGGGGTPAPSPVPIQPQQSASGGAYPVNYFEQGTPKKSGNATAVLVALGLLTLF